ncbi:MAG TPA: rhodanese-like domain-containing protein [Gaiellaceae bacterium]|jgi:glyoxylase-like metal-dependent hydrolase (beta-lactamase superfamily II)
MFFRQVLHGDLGCASYVIADGGEAAVVDPKWEIEEYLELADEQGFRIAHVLETHNHADHVSGHGRLARATGATIHVSKKAGVAYDHEPLADGDVVSVGETRIVAIATPGHRPEHTAFVVEDEGRGDAAWLVITGDSLFVGDVARPDLAVEPEEGARDLYRSVRRLLALEDFAEVWPGHIGGSLCGGAGMSQKPGSTIGFERRFNRLLNVDGEESFVTELTSHLAAQPPNFKRIVELNRGPLLIETQPLEPLAPARAKELMDAGAILVDGRDPRGYDAAHVPGSINVTMVRAAVGTRAAWVVDPEHEVLLAAASDADAVRLGRLLEAVGFRRLAGYLAGGTTAWRDAGLPIESTPALDVPGLAERLRRGDVLLLDVRDDDEWEEGHVAGSLHVPYYALRDGPLEGIANGRELAVACSIGNRSSIAASLLRRRGVDHVIHVADGGIADLAAEGIELAKGDGA